MYTMSDNFSCDHANPHRFLGPAAQLPRQNSSRRAPFMLARENRSKRYSATRLDGVRAAKRTMMNDDDDDDDEDDEDEDEDLALRRRRQRRRRRVVLSDEDEDTKMEGACSGSAKDQNRKTKITPYARGGVAEKEKNLMKKTNAFHAAAKRALMNDDDDDDDDDDDEDLALRRRQRRRVILSDEDEGTEMEDVCATTPLHRIMSLTDVAKYMKHAAMVLQCGKHMGQTFGATLEADQRYCAYVRNLKTPYDCLKPFQLFLKAVWQARMDKLDQEIQEHEEQRIRYELDKRNFAERTLQRSRLSMSIMKRAYAQKMAPKQLNI
jgi:hypothetical protein